MKTELKIDNEIKTVLSCCSTLLCAYLLGQVIKLIVHALSGSFSQMRGNIHCEAHDDDVFR